MACFFKFMVSGHCHLANDQDFGAIERKKTTKIYVPDDWMEIVLSDQKHQPFRIVKMEQAAFLDSSEMNEIAMNRKKCTDVEDVT